MTELDSKISAALNGLTHPSPVRGFDPEAYTRAFAESGRRKAAEVIALLNTSRASPFTGRKPVFLSIGGADAAELTHLLENTTGTHGVLLEYSGELAERARTHALGNGKSLKVFEGSAQDRLQDAVDYARKAVLAGHGDFMCVTCHAVIHEMPTRGKGGFNPAKFFSDIFGYTDTNVWFTYREPGEPKKWPTSVLVSADCSPLSLLNLANALVSRHPEFRDELNPPRLFGDHVVLPRALAMETIIKLFYIDELQYEIEERSTSVDHDRLISILSMAIGQRAFRERRAAILTEGAATTSFCSLWMQYGIEVLGLDLASGANYFLPVPESQTRVISWRVCSPGGTGQVGEPPRDVRLRYEAQLADSA